MTRRFSKSINVALYAVGVIALTASLAQAEVRTHWATVHSSGTVEQSSGGVFVEKTDLGNYLVHVSGEEINRCAFDATIGSPGDSAPAIGFITVYFSHTHRHAFFVNTRTKKGDAADRPFHIVVTCGKT
jgi:hypothetical protein